MRLAEKRRQKRLNTGQPGGVHLNSLFPPTRKYLQSDAGGGARNATLRRSERWRISTVSAWSSQVTMWELDNRILRLSEPFSYSFGRSLFR